VLNQEMRLKSYHLNALQLLHQHSIAEAPIEASGFPEFLQLPSPPGTGDQWTGIADETRFIPLAEPLSWVYQPPVAHDPLNDHTWL
jgi:hypothetical protein